jgi:hypothetical protein
LLQAAARCSHAIEWLEMQMQVYFGEVAVVRLLVQRGMAALYLIAFLVVLQQFKPLLGQRGLLPVPESLGRIGGFKTRFAAAPGLFAWHYSDRLLDAVGWTGVVVSALALFGVTERGPIWISVAAWLLLWFLYLSIVNAGDRFYGFGWESMLIEAGFFTAFLGPHRVAPSVLPLLILRWMLFRTEMGAGLIKLRHDQCWRDLTCLYYHYETQPLPNPLSWYFHRIPQRIHRLSALFSHFVQVAVPFGLFAPQPVAAVAGALIILHQFLLIVSGNYSWLNWLTVVLGATAFSDATLGLHSAALLAGRPSWFQALLWIIAAGAVLLSIQPALNLCSRNQAMNRSYNRWHLVNAYGAFGSVSKQRYELVIQGTSDAVVTASTEWREYEFRAKPGDPMRRPPQIAPWHLRLDWLVWFIPFSIAVTPNGIRASRYDVWFVRFIQRLLADDHSILKLMRRNPFLGTPPARIRAVLFLYRYTTPGERHATGAWWVRREVGVYLPPVALGDLRQA